MLHNRQVGENRQGGEEGGIESPDPRLPTATWGREGYRAADVDQFVARLRQALGEDPPTLAPYEVVEQRFKVTRFGRRYSLPAVDDYLDAGQEGLRRKLGYAPVTTRRPADERHRFPVGWIYLVALALIAFMLLFVLTQL